MKDGGPAKPQDAILVTGCGSGLGLDTALYLAQRGLRVFAGVLSLDEQPAVVQAAQERGVTLDVVQLDITDSASIAAAVDYVVAQAGAIYGLVNNAGGGLRGCFEDATIDEVRRLFEVNVFGTMAVTQRVLPHMRPARRGRIVTITSVGGRIASFGLTGYCASKFAEEGFGEALALEIAPFGLSSTLIEPGIVMTPHWTVNRGTAHGALNPKSAYHVMFRRHEVIADRIAASTRTRPIHVSQAIFHALTTDQPRLRRVVGQPASLLVSLRRYIPDSVFERFYFGALLRRVTRGGIG